jgi:hypothetical protein
MESSGIQVYWLVSFNFFAPGIWIRIRIRIPNTDPDPVPAFYLNANPYPGSLNADLCGSGWILVRLFRLKMYRTVYF